MAPGADNNSSLALTLEEISVVKPFGILLLSLAGLSAAASAGAHNSPGQLFNGFKGPPGFFNVFDPHYRHDKNWTAAPEIDPASAMSALTLLAGGLLVLRGRGNKK
jgi:hypothetical protein